MILKIHQNNYYGHQNKTKELFKKKYRSLKLKWMEKVNLNDVLVDGWFSSDLKEYLLKLPEEGEFKRFTGNSEGMINFLKSYGAVEVDERVSGVHIDYDDKKGVLCQEDRYGRFVGADLAHHFRIEEMLKDMPDNWGIRWSDNSKDIGYYNDKLIKSEEESIEEIKEKLIEEIKEIVSETPVQKKKKIFKIKGRK